MNSTSETHPRPAAIRQWLLAALLILTLVPAAAIAASPEPQKQATSCATVVTVQAGESLAAIAARELGNQNGWTLIVAATNAQAAGSGDFASIANPNLVVPGTRLCIPAAGGASVASASTPTRTPVRQAATATPRALAAAPTATPAATSVFSDTEPIDPEVLTLDWLREQETPGSDIVVEEVLGAAGNYGRYVVSYLSQGLKIYAYMTVPLGAKPATGWPVVVFNHGYIPPAVYRPTERYIAYQDAFARNGYIVFRPDYRGHSSSEGEATGAYGHPGYTLDVLNALASVQQYADADPDRIGMWGHSMGGYITLRAMVVRPEIKAGVIWAGVVGSYPDMLNNWRRSSTTNPVPSTIPQRARRWRQQLQEQMGTPEENPEYWASISANSYLEELSGPVQLHHGTADADVPVEFSRTLRDQISGVGGNVEYYEYAGDDHNISANLTVALQRSVEFFDEHVKN